MEVFIIIGLILLNGILSMSEIAMVSARKPRLEADAKRGSRAAKTALKLSGNPDVFLSTIQIGITLIGILTGIYSGDMLAQSFGKVLARIPALEAHSVAIAQVIIVVTVTYLTLILGELVPKRIGMSSSERVAKIVARPMSLLSKIALPFVWLLSKSTAGMLRILGINTVDGNRVTEEEIKAIIPGRVMTELTHIMEGAAEGEIEEVEQDIVERVFNLSDRNVGSIMTHRSDMVWLDTNATCDQVEDIVKNNLFNTYPVADGNLDSIVGVVHLKDLFGRLDEPGFTLSQVMRPAQYIPENLSVYNALDLMRRTGGRYGLVTDEFGSIEGIVTLKDIVRALIGGMPEVVSAFAATRDFIEARRLQQQIIEAYESDFGKHAPARIVERMRLVWKSLPGQLAKENKKFIYGALRPGARARDFEESLQWLMDYGIIHKVPRVSALRAPLSSYEDLSGFKLFCIDTGILGALSSLPPTIVLNGSAVFTEFKGSLTEQYVAQELLLQGKSPAYWSSTSGNAETDFAIDHAGTVLPLEVKAAENLKAKSLKIACDKFKLERCVRTSLAAYRDEGTLVNIPLWEIGQIDKLTK